MLELAPLALLSAATLIWLLNQTPPSGPTLALEGAGVDDDPAPAAEPEAPAWADNLMAKKGGGGSAPSPDPAIGRAALQNIQLGREWKASADRQFEIANKRQGELDKLTKRVGEQQIETQDRANRWAEQDRARYEETYRPIEDRLIEDANTWDSPERKEAAAAEAKADVMTNASQQRGAAERHMASMGIDPRSGRFQQIEKSGEVGTALAAAGAENTARRGREAQGMALRADAANMGRGLPSQAAGGAALGLSAGNAALGGANQAMGSFRANTGIQNQGYSGAMQGNSSGASMLNQQYGNQLQAWSANKQAAAQNTSGLMSGLGTIAGAAMMMPSSKHYKTDKKTLKGGALEKIEGMPVETWRYKEGSPGDDGGKPHVGSYAEDFKAKTGLGDGKSIPVQDMIGLQTKAIQELGMAIKQIQSGQGGRNKQKGKRS